MYSLLDLIKKGRIFQRDQAVTWKCRLCGYVKADTSPPFSCPICECSRIFFEVRVQEF
ncbi:rubredoxin-like domain-containing protein [Desulfosarcina variabilis]|uniref:rubredoxin-like domain-containing protein n=1 Tax=Desulfosarcina variabilis TaxID=2300 RepID=UPI003AFA65B8